MPVKNGKKVVEGIVKGTVGVVKTATSVGQRLDKLLGTQNMTAFPLQKPTKVKKKK
jgi:hypothetical protein